MHACRNNNDSSSATWLTNVNKHVQQNAQNELTGVHQGKTLLSLLQVPAGCPSRYTQLVSKLYEATPPLHPDYTNLRSCRRQFISTTEKLKPT